MAKVNIADRTTTKSLGFCGFGLSSNAADVDVKDGKVIRIRPVHFDEHYTREELRMWSLEKDGRVFDPGFKTLLPPISLAYKTRTYSPNRIPYPLKRVDWDPNGERNPQNRGISKYERISWDEATSLVAAELKRVHEKYGPYSVYCQGEGHGEAKNYGGSHGCQISLLNMVGGCTTQARNADSWEGWYWGAKWIWGMDPVGQNVYQNGVFKDITDHGDAVLYWGADPETTPWGWGGQLPSRMCYWFNEIGVKSIFICPDVNYTNAVHADKWIPVIPNTDAALQLAIAYVWLTEDLYDKDYIATHADGFDWFAQYVLGNLEDGTPKTPKWAEEKCGVKAYTIKALARYWAKSNVSIGHCNGGGYIRSCFSHEPARLEVALLGMQSLGKPGANQFQFIEWTLFGLPSKSPVPRSEVYPSTESAYHGFDMNMGESFIVKTKLPQAIMNPPVEWYGHTAAGYPKEDQLEKFQFPLPGKEGVKMIWSDAPCWSTCWNGGFEFEEALRSPNVECIVMQHPWMENDTLFADIIMPTATMMECPDLSGDNYNGQTAMLYLEEQAVDRVGEAKSEFEAVCEVARKLEQYGDAYENLFERYTGGLDCEAVLRKGFEESGIADRITYEELKEQRFWCSPVIEGWEDEPAGLIAFHDDPEGNPLDTPTGKLEYYSTVLASYFPDDKVRASYPQWIEETDRHHERITSDRAQDYPFPLMSNHPRWRVHANLDDVPWLREIDTCKIAGPDGYKYEPVWINPVDAKRLGIEHHDVVKLYNERGTVLGAAHVTERIRPGVLYQDHGSRIDAIVGGRKGLDRGGANNLICTPETTSENCAGEVTNSFLVNVAKVDVLELARQYPEEFARDYDPATGHIPEAYLVKGE